LIGFDIINYHILNALQKTPLDEVL